MMTYYREHSRFSDPGRYRAALDALPEAIPALCEAIQGLLIHVFHAHRYGVQLEPERLRESCIYDLPDMLDRLFALEEAPLTQARAPERRLVANCRGYAMLLCSVLRERGTPARLRVGFETYFHRNPPRYGDHWVCEYWDAARRRWILVDAQLDPLHRETFGIDFDPCDLPESRFILAGDMWNRCRRGVIDPALCGILNLWGRAYVRGNVVRDVLCLRKIEYFPWDGAPLTLKDEGALTPSDIELLDRLAGLTYPSVAVEELGAVYAAHPGALEARKVSIGLDEDVAAAGKE